MDTYEEFGNKIRKVREKRAPKACSDYRTRDIYRWLKKNKLIDPDEINEARFGKIIKDIHLAMREALYNGGELLLPERMGLLEIRKKPVVLKMKGNKVITNRPVNWKETVRLWHEDKEARDNKTLVRQDVKAVYSIIYNKRHACYDNKTFYRFLPMRGFKKELSNKIKNDELNICLI